jgi:hypothetical protein
MRNRPTIKTPCVADRYVSGPERIAEVHSRRLQLGCLISVRETDAGKLVIEVYSADPGVVVRIDARDIPAAGRDAAR